jgi:hypothetical protein
MEVCALWGHQLERGVMRPPASNKHQQALRARASVADAKVSPAARTCPGAGFLLLLLPPGVCSASERVRSLAHSFYSLGSESGVGGRAVLGGNAPREGAGWLAFQVLSRMLQVLPNPAPLS